MKKINWTNTLFLSLTPLLSIILLIYHIYTEGFVLSAWILATAFYIITGLSITAGYHRLFAHRSYKAKWPIKFLYLLFGAASFQNSCLKWATDHRKHHRHVDEEEDPYSIKKGFFHAHMGWIFFDEAQNPNFPKDLKADTLVMWQHRNYILIAIIVGLGLPTLIGYFLGSWSGGLAIAGLGRIVFVHHCTFFINSLCHYIGQQTYTDKNSARDSFVMALFTYGEGYHNFHHTFQIDYRNGLKWYHFDPTKWAIHSMSWVGLTEKLKKVSDLEILKAKLAMDLKRIKSKQGIDLEFINSLKSKTEQAQVKFQNLIKEYKSLKKEKTRKAQDQINKMKTEIKMAKIELEGRLQQWNTYYKFVTA